MAKMDERDRDGSRSGGKMPPLPKFADMEGAGHETPSWNHLAYLFCFAGIVIVIGIGLIAFDYVVAIALVVALFVEADRFAVTFLARKDPRPPSAELTAALEGDDADARHAAEKEVALGGLLADGDGGPMATFNSALTKEEAAKVMSTRAAEADSTWTWLEGLGGPDVIGSVETSSDDGCHLAGHVLVIDPDSKHWVILVHGFGGAWKEGMLYARHYAERGYNMLFCEMRGHDSSGGPLIGMGWPDRRDLVAWAEWLVAEKGDDVEVVLHGHSMGGASVCMAAGESDLPSQVKAAVSDCAYSDLWNELACIVKGGMGLSVHPLMDAMRLCLMRHDGGYDVAKVSPEDAVSHSRVPVLLIHGEQDTFVPPYMAKRLADACGGAAAHDGHELVMMPGAGHCQSSFADPFTYYSRLFFFLERFI
jgi:fermentation-respiration switch protein FrsA (DUF1100 family)